MLCRLCETFFTNIVHEDFSTWRRIEQGWSTFKHGNYASILANADAGCDVCSMFDIVRSERTSNYRELNEKWQVQAASIDIKYDYDKTGVGRGGSRWALDSQRIIPASHCGSRDVLDSFRALQP